MMVVRMLLNSWATLDARVPTLLKRWARSNCSRNCSVSVWIDRGSSVVIHRLRQGPGRGGTSAERDRGGVALSRVGLDEKGIGMWPRSLHRKCRKCWRFKLFGRVMDVV